MAADTMGPPRRPYMGEPEYGMGGRDGRMGSRMGPPQGSMVGPPGPGMGPPTAAAEPFVVDREKTCPLLLRVWCKSGSHHRLEDFATRGKEPPGDIQIYTWMDATLRELSDLIKEVKPEARAKGSRLSFAFIYPDRTGRNVMRQVGMVHSSRPSEDDNRTLKTLRFQTGDFLDVAIFAAYA